MRPLKSTLLLMTTLLFGMPCLANNFGNMRIGGVFGVGQAGAQNSETTRVEGPLGFGAFVDYTINSRLTIGAEHQRSFGTGSTAVGFTGLSFKWYFWTPQPQWMVNAEDQITRSFLIQKNFVPYLGFASGFAQASFPARSNEKDVLVVGPYASAKGGLEYPVTGRWGARSEFVYGMTVGGKGRAELVHLLFGLYYFL